jgi:hypothetical protein
MLAEYSISDNRSSLHTALQYLQVPVLLCVPSTTPSTLAMPVDFNQFLSGA